MDAIVIKAIARWPDVPHVYDWLSLDRRGQWRLQDSPITNAHINEFIGRNYDRDERGAWFFQNGPQRVYVRLESAPWVLRIGNRQSLVTHTGLPVRAPSEALLDENGNVLIAFERGVGVVADRDLPALIESMFDAKGKLVDEEALARLATGASLRLCLEWQGARLPLSFLRRSEIARRHGFIHDPRPPAERSQAASAP